MKLLKNRDRIAAIIIGMADLLWTISGSLFLFLLSGLNFTWTTALLLVALTLVQIFFLVMSSAYRLPRRWGFNEAIPVSLRAAFQVVVVLLLFGGWMLATDRSEIPLLFQFVLLYLLFVLPGLVLIRLIAGRIQLLLYRRGLALRRSLVISDGEGADYLLDRITNSDWLGERIIDQELDRRSTGCSNGCNGLMETLDAFPADVVWLTNDMRDQDIEQLPKHMASKHGRNAVWRILPEQFQLLDERLGALLTASERANLINTLEHSLSLPELSVAVLGSRGGCLLIIVA